MFNKTKKIKRIYNGPSILKVYKKDPLKIIPLKLEKDYSNLDIAIEEPVEEIEKEEIIEEDPLIDFSELEFNEPCKITIKEANEVKETTIDLKSISLYLNSLKKTICNTVHNEFNANYNYVYYDIYDIKDYSTLSHDDILSDFAGDKLLKSIEINNYYNEIGDYCFKDCENLENVSINSNSLYIINKGAFINCIKLKTVILNNIVTKLNDNTFENCKSIETINLNNVIHLGANCFKNSGLKTLLLNSCIRFIGYRCFFYSQLKYIELSDNKYFNYISEQSFAFSKLEAIKLPNNIQYIQRGAFEGCDNLKTIIMSQNIKKIEKDAFKNIHDDFVILFKRNTNHNIEINIETIDSKKLLKVLKDHIRNANIYVSQKEIFIDYQS